MSMSATRIDRRFAELKAQGRAALVTFLTAGDPDPDTSLAILRALPAAGADVIELGMPFTDPRADGPAIQLSSQRALKRGQSLGRTLDMVRAFRSGERSAPIVLMGYYNPVYIYGVERFLADARDAGVDGLIIVDLPPEEDAELCLPALAAGLNFIRLATPTTDERVQLCFDFYMIEAKPENLIGDRAYDSDPLDEELRREGIEMIAPHRANRSKPPTQDRRRLSRFMRRWLVERFFAWIQWQRRILVRWEYHTENFLGFVQLACLVILFRRF